MIPIHRLIKREQAERLLGGFTAAVPGSGLALARPDGNLFVRAGAWPEDFPSAQVAAALAEAAAGQMLKVEGFDLYPLQAGSRVVGALAAYGPETPARALQSSLELLLEQSLELREMGRETLDRYREINLLYHIGETIGACLDPEEIPALLLEDARRIIRTDVGAVLLPAPAGEVDFRIKAGSGSPDQLQILHESAQSLIAQVRLTSRPDIYVNTPGGSLQFSSVLCAPLKSRERVLGVLLLGRLEGGLDFTAGDEKLAMALASQAAAALEKAWLHLQEIQRQRMEEELAVARRIQLSLLPRGCPVFPGWECAAFYQAAHQVGGDFYDFFPLQEGTGRMGIVIADVTGKGVPAALMMAFSRAILRTESARCSSPREVLQRTNHLIEEDNRSRLFLSAFYAALDPLSGRLVYANGGHERPLWLRAGGGAATKNVAATKDVAAAENLAAARNIIRELEGGGVLLGAFRSIEIDEREVWIDPGDLLVFFTDGVTEARDGTGELFGDERLQAALAASAGGSAGSALETIVQAVRNFTGDAPQSDDLTLVVVKRTG